MEARIYLKRYRLFLDQIGLPVVIRRSATEGTFRAEDLRTGKEVAAQVVPLSALRNMVREEIEAEANSARALDHVNIPALHDFGFEEGQAIYVTDYFDGTTAAAWVKKHGPMPVGAVLRIAHQVVSASSLATFHGIVHHAINPTNIMLVPGQTAEGEWPLIKVLNFVGVAPDLAPPESTDVETIVPSQFASPEQLVTGDVDFRSQMYSLGGTLWFLLTGTPPLGGADAVEEAGHLPAVVKRLLAQMLATDPTERPLDPLALQAQIEDCVAQLNRRDAVASKLGLPLASEATVPIKVPHRPTAWKPIALAAVLLSVAALSAVVLSGHYRKQKTIGVPIGVAENSAPTRVATQNASPAATEPEPIVITPPGQEPPIVESVETAQNEAAAADSMTTETAEQSTTQLAAVETPSETQTPVEEPTLVAATDSFTPPSAEISATPPPEEKIAEQNEKVEASATPAPVAVKAKEEPRKSNPEPSKPNERKKVRVTTAEPEANRPPVSQGSGRAQFLGTTPDGNLVFGLPSSEKVYLSPPAPTGREEKTRSRPRRSPPPETIDGLPVRPALPPDPE